jgi:uncharacterized protein YndB with AHSA1/START domain
MSNIGNTKFYGHRKLIELIKLKFIIGFLAVGTIATVGKGQTGKSKSIQIMTDKIIISNAILNCTIDSAFSYFAENDLLTQWLTGKADVEMKEGGKYELFWTPEDPDPTNNSTFGCKVLAVERPFYINVEWAGNVEQKKIMNNVRPLTNVTVLFTRLSAAKTKITLIHTGWRPGDNWEAARQYFINAWAGALNHLEGLVNTATK